MAWDKPPEKPDEEAAPQQRVRIAPVLPSRTAKNLRLPTREEIVQLALDVYKLALDHERTYNDRNGNVKSYPQPDFKSACDALRVASDVARLTGRGERDRKEEEELAQSDLDAEEALGKLRSKIARAAAKEEKKES